MIEDVKGHICTTLSASERVLEVDLAKLKKGTVFADVSIG